MGDSLEINLGITGVNASSSPDSVSSLDKSLRFANLSPSFMSYPMEPFGIVGNPSAFPIKDAVCD